MTLRVGLLGTIDHSAFVTEFGTKQCADAELVGIAEPDEKTGRAMAEKYQTQWFSGKEALLDAGVDAVGVFTPFYEKADDICGCLARGIHVLSDKPVVTNRQGLAKVTAAAQAHPDVVLAMALSLRIQPQYVKVRELLRSGAIGKPATVYARRAYRMKKAERPAFMFDSAKSGGMWVELAVHDLDYMRWLLDDDYQSVSATHGNVSHPSEPFEDHAAGVFQMKGGVKVTIEQNRLVPTAGHWEDNRLSIVGTEGVLDYGPDGVSLWNNESQRTKVDLAEADWTALFRNFVDAIGGKAKLLASTADVLRATQVSIAAYESAKAGGQSMAL